MHSLSTMQKNCKKYCFKTNSILKIWLLSFVICFTTEVSAAKKIKKISQSGATPVKIPFIKIQDMKGEISVLDENKHQPKLLKNTDAIYSNASYLTGDKTNLILKFDDLTFIRVGSNSKFSLSKINNDITFELQTGSIRILHSATKNKNYNSMMIFKTPGGIIETNEAKFSMVAQPLFNETRIYVEKGVVTVVQDQEKLHVFGGEQFNTKTHEAAKLDSDAEKNIQKSFFEQIEEKGSTKS